MKLLLVEDDRMIGESVQDALRAEHYAVDWVQDGSHAEVLACSEPFDLVLLDLGLPGKDGIDVLKAIRRRRLPLQVLIATARDEVEQRIAGLDAGADDYIVKPYDFGELLARVRAALRRAAGQGECTYVRGELVVKLATREVSLGHQSVILSLREWSVLALLLARPGVILSRAQLEERIFGADGEPASNAVEVYIHGLRKKLGADLIQNVRGVGYVVPKPG